MRPPPAPASTGHVALSVLVKGLPFPRKPPSPRCPDGATEMDRMLRCRSMRSRRLSPTRSSPAMTPSYGTASLSDALCLSYRRILGHRACLVRRLLALCRRDGAGDCVEDGGEVGVFHADPTLASTILAKPFLFLSTFVPRSYISSEHEQLSRSRHLHYLTEQGTPSHIIHTRP